MKFLIRQNRDVGTTKIQEYSMHTHMLSTQNGKIEISRALGGSPLGPLTVSFNIDFYI